MAYARQWRRCDAGGTPATDIAGATGPRYTATEADVGHALRVRVGASNGGGQRGGGVGADRGGGRDRAAFGARRRRSTTSTPAVGQTLNVTDGTWSGSQPLTMSYQWRRCTTAALNRARTSRSRRAASYGSTPATRASGCASASPRRTRPAPRSRDSGATRGRDPAAGRPGQHGAPDRDRRRQRRRDPHGRRGHLDRLAGARRSPASGCAAAARTSRPAPEPARPARATCSRRPTSARACACASTRTTAAATRTRPRPRRPSSPPTRRTTPAARDHRRGERRAAAHGDRRHVVGHAADLRPPVAALHGGTCADIAGATGSTYQLAAADVGKTVLVRVTATNPAGSESADSLETAAVAGAPGQHPAPDRVRRRQRRRDADGAAGRVDRLAGADGHARVDALQRHRRRHLRGHRRDRRELRARARPTSARACACASAPRTGPARRTRSRPPRPSSPPTRRRTTPRPP